MKYNTLISKLGICILAALSFSACSDDSANIVDGTRAALASPTVTSATLAANKVQCSWSRVEGAQEYSYVLRDAQGTIVDEGNTQLLTYTNGLLSPNTLYTLYVTAYPEVANPNYQSSIASTLVNKTDAVNITSSVSGSKISLTWSNILDADSVGYTVTRAQTGKSETLFTKTSTAEYTVKDLGDYEMSLSNYYSGGTPYAIAGCSKSISFPSVSGTATLVGVTETDNLTLKLNADCSYTIAKFYGGTKDLIFSLGTDGSIKLLNADSGSTYKVGRSEDDEDIYTVTINVSQSSVCDASGNKVATIIPSGGTLKLSVKTLANDDTEATGTYTFKW